MKKANRGAKLVGALLLSWWLVLLIVVGLGGNALMAFKAWEAGNAGAALLFTAFFVGACVYLYRTYNAREEIGGNLRG